ncbi:MAG: DUF3108 domain-containing protein [Blastocatellia bacterium]|nr:DUF3108 domain-containing protein [Blastocatellia bacterium]
MRSIKFGTLKLNRLAYFLVPAFAAVTLICSAAFFSTPVTDAQTVGGDATGYRIGERLTYTVSMGRIPNAAYAEISTVSRGRIGDKDAVELRAKFKTLDLASATLYLIDENRTTFVSTGTGFPLHTSVSQNTFGLPVDKTHSFLTAPTLHDDLLTLIHKIRQSGGTGSLSIQENEKVYPVAFQLGAIEKHRTGAGEFETNVVLVQSEYFTDHGISDLRINLSSNEAKIPVLVRFQTPKGLVKASLASVQMTEPEVVVQSVPAPVRPPVPDRTPKPVVTPTPYIDNQPLAPELAFDIGEQLDYRILAAGQQVATMRLAARERKQFNGNDSLLLEATFSDSRSGSPFVAGDLVRAYVDPDTLSPRQIELKFGGALRSISKLAKFDQQGNLITFGAGDRVDAPVGTHSILSLIYALRSFNLKPSRDLNNPINDTRVAVFWESETYIFTLRPSPPELITLNGAPIAAQLVTVTTKHPVLDSLNIRIWLGNDESRVPLRFAAGSFQADLITSNRQP